MSIRVLSPQETIIIYTAMGMPDSKQKLGMLKSIKKLYGDKYPFCAFIPEVSKVDIMIKELELKYDAL